MRKCCLALIIGLAVCATQAAAQVLPPDMTLERDFAAQVKSLDEFMARFNGEESKPGIEADTVGRYHNLLALFDFQMNRKEQSADAFRKQVLDFVAAVEAWPDKLRLKDAKAWGEAVCLMKYGKKEMKVTLLMQQERIDNERSRWAIAGVKGLAEANLYNDRRATISPVDHEVHFMSLYDFFQSNPRLTPALRAQNRDIDELSLFFGLSIAGAIKLTEVNELKFHFTNVPGYVFVVEEKGRRGQNSGWLITNFEQKTDEDKTEYIRDLFGIKKQK